MITLYQSEWCPQCHRVRELLTELGLSYTNANVAEDPERRADVIALSGQNSVPVLQDEDRVVIGSEEIIEYLAGAYPAADDAEDHAAHAAWRIATFSSLEPPAALARLKELLQKAGFKVVSETPGPEISERLPDSYVLLHATVPAAAVKAIELDPTAVSAVLLPLAVVPIEGGSAIVAADPVGQVWLYAEPPLRNVQGAVKKRLGEIFAEL